MESEFLYMLFLIAKTTGRRLGEFYGVQEKKLTGHKQKGEKKVYDRKGNRITVPRLIPIYKKLDKWNYGVKVKDIDFERSMIKIWVLKRRRFIQDETILTPEVLMLLKSYIKKYKLADEDYVFRHYSYRHIQNRVEHYAKKARIEKPVSFHNFRHFFITELLKQGWSHNEVVKLTGHKSIGTIVTYDHVIAEDLKDKALLAIRNI